MSFCKIERLKNDFDLCLRNISSNFSAVHNLYELVLRQQRVEAEEESEDKVEDPMKVVKKKLEKVKQHHFPTCSQFSLIDQSMKP